MKRKAIFLFLFIVFWFGPLFSETEPLKLKDISRIMERFFGFHIENRELTPTLVRRSMKIYFEQFDPEKAYLLEEEVRSYFAMSDATVLEMYQRLQHGDYSDFIALNQLIQKAIVRAQRLRVTLAEQLVNSDLEFTSGSSSSKYASSEEDILQRQKGRMVRFFLFHKERTHLETPERRAKVFALFEKKMRQMESNYLFVSSSGIALSRGMIEHLLAVRIAKSLAKSLDTHTAFFSPEEAYEMRLSLEKQFEGVGVVLTEGVDGVMIAELIQGSPAQECGKIQINDLLVAVDGKSILQISFEEVLDLLKKKSEIILGFKRFDESTQREIFFQVPLKKRPIVMQEDRIQTSVEKFGAGIIGKIALYSFYESSDGVSSEKDVKEAIRAFRQQGELVGLVLDLRENSGGFLSQAIKVAGLFISNGVVVISKYGKGEVHFLRNIVGKSFFNGPLTILTSKMSASASEIVAQALQDYGVGIVVGDERTFGKGSIQYQTVTDEKADLFFKVTVGRYYTASGKSTQIDGVLADIVVPTQYAPYNIGERFLEYPLPPDRIDPAYLDPLTDLDAKTQRLFQRRYLPYLQRVVPFWRKMLPTLQKNSAYRLSHDPNFQLFLKRQEKIRARQSTLPVNTIDEQIHIGMEDLQMSEAVNIIKDMILIEAESRPVEAVQLSPTGTE